MRLRRRPSGLYAPEDLGVRGYRAGPRASLLAPAVRARRAGSTYVTPDPGGYFSHEGDIPGAPVGMVDEPFEGIELSTPIGTDQVWQYSRFPWPPTGPTRIEHVTDAAAPYSPDYWDMIFEDGFIAGSSPGRAVLENRNAWNGGAGFFAYYGSIIFRCSANWDYHPTDNKLFYWGIIDAAGVPGHQYIGFGGDGRPTFITQYPGESARRIPNGTTETHANNVAVQQGTYHELQWLATANNAGDDSGTLTVWLDDVLSFGVTDIVWSPTNDGNFFGVNIDSVWGGTTIPTENGEQRLRWSHLRITCSTG